MLLFETIFRFQISCDEKGIQFKVLPLLFKLHNNNNNNLKLKDYVIRISIKCFMSHGMRKTVAFVDIECKL
jgi:hypothetical protein